ncbi:D-alanyl-D-alanine carboxypeptidase/D-alanyl-D-alanine-endopeptidase [Lentibacter algarum]|uniref:D-alanyl-D-alanine carboxypeptidase/D-alanyl-D-alanine endopeptidase n=1 Tax=Lentibacter algarum TaxID=576131 RepID=UPI001C06EF1E|nr:D-alanyl-D-alanine carboxypeptidase/D-alanyl-D-alanine-endopeptidase [Lentibacter algarum]MBU2980869.1 D-alanyl-D-alanine carboxypeptidase/D-alanyl-D-alanine-endopeptidase [Lentibacter algarum]
MKYRFSKRLFLSGVASLIGAAAAAKAPARSLRPQMRPGGGGAARGAAQAKSAAPAAPKITSAAELIKQAKLGGRVGFAVADAKTGLILESGNGSKGQPPASVTKAVTALYALDVLGNGHRFFTELHAVGKISGGVLKGDLVLKGGGDPTLSTDRLALLAASLKKSGVKEVRGKFIVDGTNLPQIDRIDKDQPDHVGYNPAISGICLNYNRVHFEWKNTGGKWATTMDARSAKYRPEVSFATVRIAAREQPVYTYQSKGGKDIWTVAQGALGKGGSRWLPVRQPEIYAGEVFRTFARSQGIVLKAPQTDKGRAGTVIARQQSVELRKICQGFLKYSNNLTAEMVGLAATKARKGKVASVKASASEMNRWAGAKLGMKQSKFVDHSGLGDASRATAKDMALALVKARGVIAPILKPIAMRNKDGKVNKNHPIKVNAKTGTLNFVSALAGYARAADGTVMSFAIFAADTDKRAKIKRGDRDRPQGTRSWNGRAKGLQQRLIERWGALYGS